MNTAVRNALKQYRNVGVKSGVEEAGPHRLIQMLMDGALSRIATAIGLLKRNEPGSKGENIGLAISIIGGLQGSLNMEEGGDVARNLDRLYTYMCHALLEGNANNDTNKLEEAHALLSQIRDGWVGIATVNKDPPPQAGKHSAGEVSSIA